MNELTIIIPGKPIAQARPRFARRGKFVHAYSPQETEAGKVRWTIMSQYLGEEPIAAGIGIKLYCRFFMPIPASASKKQRTLMEGCAVPHIKKPDLDNLVKFIKDCATGILWVDDSQVVSLVASKAYHPQPATEIRLEWRDENGG